MTDRSTDTGPERTKPFSPSFSRPILFNWSSVILTRSFPGIEHQGAPISSNLFPDVLSCGWLSFKNIKIGLRTIEYINSMAKIWLLWRDGPLLIWATIHYQSTAKHFKRSLPQGIILNCPHRIWDWHRAWDHVRLRRFNYIFQKNNFKIMFQNYSLLNFFTSIFIFCVPYSIRIHFFWMNIIRKFSIKNLFESLHFSFFFQCAFLYSNFDTFFRFRTLLWYIVLNKSNKTN